MCDESLPIYQNATPPESSINPVTFGCGPDSDDAAFVDVALETALR